MTEIISPLNGIVNTEYIKFSLITQTFLLIAPLILSILVAKIRVQAIRDRIKPVLDSRPISNFQLLHGHAIGLVALLFLIYAFSFSLLFVLATVLAIIGVLNWSMGAGLEFFIAVIAFDVFPLLAFWTGVATILNSTINSRTVNIIIIAALSVLLYIIMHQAPMTLAAHLGHVGMLTISLPSSIVDNEIDIGLIISRIGILGITYFLILISAHILKRNDDGRNRAYIWSYVMVLLIAIQFISWPIIAKGLTNTQHEKWRMTQEMLSLGSGGDILEISGQIEIDPGEKLHLDITMQIQLDLPDTQDNIILSFNPGMNVHLLDVNGSKQTYRFKDGILTIPISREIVFNEYLSLRLIASGIPNSHFGFLNEVVDIQNDWSTNNIFTRSLGYKTLIYDKKYIALPFTSRWLPTPITSTRANQRKTGESDFFSVDINVTVPLNWTIAAPHRDFYGSDSHSIHYRVAPKVPISNITLIASEFSRSGWNIDGVDVELLLHKNHANKLSYLEEYSPGIRVALKEVLEFLREHGISYPLNVLSLVEVPSNFRTYSGGWQMNSIISAPGLVMLREFSLPNVKLHQIANLDSEQYSIERRSQFAIGTLGSFFSSDPLGGDIFREGARNILEFATQPTGDSAPALSCILSDLVFRNLPVSRVVDEAPRNSFSATLANKMRIEGYLHDHVLVPQTLLRKDEYLNLVAQLFDVQVEGWRVLEKSLSELDFQREPKMSFNVLSAKCQAFADMLYNGLRQDEALGFLKELRNRFSGRSYTLSDIEKMAFDLESSKLAYLVEWIDSPGLPGYLLDVESVGLVENHEGLKYFETTILVRNDENISGVVTFELSRGESGFNIFLSEYDSHSFFIPANTTVRVRLNSRFRPSAVRVYTYISLNQGSLLVTLPTVNELNVRTESGASIETVEEDWKKSSGIIIDDLDGGFNIKSSEKPNEKNTLDFLWGNLPFGMRSDLELPYFAENEPLQSTWTRVRLEGAFGKYRRTAAVGIPGFREVLASFRSSIPHSSRWQLDLHMPVNPKLVQLLSGGNRNWLTSGRLSRTLQELGIYKIWVVQSGDSMSVEFDASKGKLGWNTLGSFDLKSEQVEVHISNRTNGSIVYADAVRWSSAPN